MRKKFFNGKVFEKKGGIMKKYYHKPDISSITVFSSEAIMVSEIEINDIWGTNSQGANTL